MERTDMQPKTPELETTFANLVDEWQRDRRPGVDLHEMTKHPAYQRVINLGEKVVPLILRHIEKNPSHWFPALHAITGANPVPEGCQGNLEKMTAAWLRWGRDQGYSW